VPGNQRCRQIRATNLEVLAVFPRGLLCLAGPSTDRARVGTLRRQTNFLTRPSLDSVIQIHGSGQRGKRAKVWGNSSPIAELGSISVQMAPGDTTLGRTPLGNSKVLQQPLVHYRRHRMPMLNPESGNCIVSDLAQITIRGSYIIPPVP
jgi:hypothetical protein